MATSSLPEIKRRLEQSGIKGLIETDINPRELEEIIDLTDQRLDYISPVYLEVIIKEPKFEIEIYRTNIYFNNQEMINYLSELIKFLNEKLVDIAELSTISYLDAINADKYAGKYLSKLKINVYLYNLGIFDLSEFHKTLQENIIKSGGNEGEIISNLRDIISNMRKFFIRT